MRPRTKGEQKAYLDGYQMCADCIEKYLSDEGKKKLEYLLTSVRNAVEIEDETESEIDVVTLLRSVKRWTFVKEGLPRDNTPVLMTVQDGDGEPKVRRGYYCKDGYFSVNNGDYRELRDAEVIAWMPDVVEEPEEGIGDEKCRGKKQPVAR